jgi:hypothetical protein
MAAYKKVERNFTTQKNGHRVLLNFYRFVNPVLLAVPGFQRNNFLKPAASKGLINKNP